MNDGIGRLILRRAAGCGDLQGKPVGKADDGFSGTGDPACVYTCMVPAVGVQHNDRVVFDSEPVGTAVFIRDSLFGIGIQRQCHDNRAILTHFEMGGIALTGEKNPDGDSDADQHKDSKKKNICFI